MGTEPGSVLWVSADGVAEHPRAAVSTLRGRENGYVWADIGADDTDAAAVLAGFGFHQLAIRDSLEHSHLAKIRAYPDHLFLILHAPDELGDRDVRSAQLAVFIGLDYLVTVRGPGTGATPGGADVSGVRGRVLNQRLRPSSTAELAHAIASSVAAAQETVVGGLATRVAALEEIVLGQERRDPEATLEQMFRLRHQLVAVRTMAAEGQEVLARMVALAHLMPPESRPFIEDLADRFERVRSLCDAEREFLRGIVEFFESRTSTQMNVAMERLALIAAVVLPINAVAGIYGMNLIVSDRTAPGHIATVLAIMVTISALMLVWARRHGWW